MRGPGQWQLRRGRQCGQREDSRGGPRMSADLSTGRARTRQHEAGRNSTTDVRTARSDGSSGTR
jgi:hypothetical protein